MTPESRKNQNSFSGVQFGLIHNQIQEINNLPPSLKELKCEYNKLEYLNLNNYIDNKYKQMNAVIQLYKALGGGN